MPALRRGVRVGVCRCGQAHRPAGGSWPLPRPLGAGGQRPVRCPARGSDREQARSGRGTGASASSPCGETRCCCHVAPAQPDPGFLDSKTGGKAAYAAGDYVSALEHYKEAIAKNPDDGDALNNLGQLLSRKGDSAAAIPHLEKASRIYPNVWAYRFNLAHARGRLGNWSEAVDDYRQARNLFPDDYVTHFNLGMALHKLGDEEAAVYEFRRGAELAPSEPSFHLSLGIGYEQLNLPDQAVKLYEQYLALAPSTPDADKVKARIELLRKPA